MLSKRLRYFGAKIHRAWSDGTLRQKAGRFFVSSIRIPVETTCAYLRLPSADRRLDVAAGFADQRGEAGHSRPRPEHLRRIIAAYQAAKEAQRAAPPAFAIHGLWSEWIDVNFQSLVHALNTEDTSALAALLENLHREQFTIGTGSSYDEYVRYRTALTGRFYVPAVWGRYRDLFRARAGPDREIRYPLVGNPAGIHCQGEVIPIHAWRHAYHALEMSQWLQDTPHAVVVEIGGGIGGQAYQMLRLAHPALAQYLIFDIPEVASVCSYFLLSAFPEKRIRLFGEGPVLTGASEDYEIAVFPHFAVVGLADRSVDLFHNSCGFSEMDGASSVAYLRVIERACRRYFSHINHDTRFQYRNADGSLSTNVIGSELLPDPRRFHRIFKQPRVFRLPEDRFYTYFEYLYERCDGISPVAPDREAHTESFSKPVSWKRNSSSAKTTCM
jgi:putative sugar O-methyltransferase